MVSWLNIYPDTVAPPVGGGDAGCSCPHKWVKYRIPCKRKHPHQSFCQFQRIWGGVLLGGSAFDILPNLLKPLSVQSFRYHGQYPCCEAGTAVAARFALHQDKFDVVFDDTSGLIRFAEKTGAIPGCFQGSIGDFVPDNRCEVIKSQMATVFLNTRVQGKYHVPAKPACGQHRHRPPQSPVVRRGLKPAIPAAILDRAPAKTFRSLLFPQAG